MHNYAFSADRKKPLPLKNLLAIAENFPGFSAGFRIHGAKMSAFVLFAALHEILFDSMAVVPYTSLHEK